MKRDMDIIRQIILATADLPYASTLDKLEGVSPDDFVVHVIWLEEAGLIIADAQAGSGSGAQYAMVSRLTWDGCEFADAVMDDGIWKKAKESVIKPGFSFTFDILKEWLKGEISNGLPTIRSISS